MEKSNWHYFFEKVTQIFSSKLKSNALLKKLYYYITCVTCNALPPTLAAQDEPDKIMPALSR